MGRAKKNVEVEAQVIARGNVVPMMTEARVRRQSSMSPTRMLRERIGWFQRSG